LVLNELYTAGQMSSYVYVFRRDLYTNTTTNIYIYNDNPNSGGIVAAVNRRNGDMIVCWAVYSAPYVYANRIALTTRTGAIRWRKEESTWGQYGLLLNRRAEFDYVGGFWGYGDYYQYYINETYRLLHFDVYGNNLANIYLTGIDFLYDLAVEWEGDGVWYTDQVNNFLVHKNSTGTTLQSIALPQPRAVCATLDSGCWVIDNTNQSAYRYTSSGILSKSVSLGRTASRMAYDYADGFWYVSGNYVYHVTSEGTQDFSILLNSISRLYGAKNGCVALNGTTMTASFIDRSTGTITRTWTSGSYSAMGVFSTDLDDAISYQGLDSSDLLPMASDPVWGTVSGSLAWQEIRKDGYFLPKAKYHQVEVTLRGGATLNKVLMAPAIKVQDIASQTYKNMYIKTDIPVDADITDYEARIKTWWGVE
jgi:hypothetical protein